MKVFFLFFFLFYAAAVIQTSFLVHFMVFGFVVGIVVCLWLLCNILAGWDSLAGLAASLWAGFFMDLFSSSAFGLWITVFLAVSFGIQFIQRQYVRLPSL